MLSSSVFSVAAGQRKQAMTLIRKGHVWPAWNEARKRLASDAICFDLPIGSDGAPTGRHGWQKACCDTARET